MNILLKGDCLDIMHDIPAQSIDMILCDLPYGTTQCHWDTVIPFDQLWAHYNRLTKPKAPIALFGAEPFSSALRLSNLKNYKYDWIWEKPKATGFLNAKKQPMRCHEIISVFYRKQCLYNPQKTFGHNNSKSFTPKAFRTDVYNKLTKDNYYESTERYPRSIQVFITDNQNSSLHPTQKPVALFEYLIRTYTNPGDTVLDNCAGSGTTAIACINTGRKYICIEKGDKEFDIMENRVNKYLEDI